MFFQKYQNSQDAFIIAEVGQNHQGDVSLAKEFVIKFAALGADAVKFQVRNNRYLFDDASYEKEYDSSNAFADTYGAHREALELSHDEMREVRELCRDHNVKFMCTPFDEPSLEFLLSIETDILKVASFDLGNLALLDKMAASKLPIVMSIGGGKIDHIKASMDIIKKHHDDIALLHCVSEYPCVPERLGLANIPDLMELFPDTLIGLSDHFSGILSGPVGYMKGARIFEKHVTMNRAWKGTDHSFALEPKGFESFVRDIRRVPMMDGRKPENELGNEYVFKKLGKSLAASTDIEAGQIISLDNMRGRIFKEPGISVRDSYLVLGKKLKSSIKSGEKITADNLTD